MIRETFHAKADKQFKTHLSGIPLKTINCATLKKASLRFFFYLCVCACVLKHLAESPQEDKIICTWLLRGALHKDDFSKITAWLAFIPYFWKPSCFLRLPLLPLLLLPSLTIPSPLCHVLVFICWFCSSSFSPCVKNERLKIGWARTGKAGGGKREWKAGGKSNDCTSVKSLSAVPRLFSSLHWQLQYSPKPHPYTSYSENQMFSIDNAKWSLRPVLKGCIPMWWTHSMTRGTALISHRQLHKNSL